MRMGQLPLDVWMVVEHASIGRSVLTSLHKTQGEAEAERDRRNREAQGVRFRACMLLEPVAQRMGGRRHPMHGLLD